MGLLPVPYQADGAGHKGENILIISGLDKAVTLWLNKCKGFVRDCTPWANVRSSECTFVQFLSMQYSQLERADT
jgi:hypothetical protein